MRRRIYIWLGPAKPAKNNHEASRSIVPSRITRRSGLEALLRAKPPATSRAHHSKNHKKVHVVVIISFFDRASFALRQATCGCSSGRLRRLDSVEHTRSSVVRSKHPETGGLARRLARVAHRPASLARAFERTFSSVTFHRSRAGCRSASTPRATRTRSPRPRPSPRAPPRRHRRLARSQRARARRHPHHRPHSLKRNSHRTNTRCPRSAPVARARRASFPRRRHRAPAIAAPRRAAPVAGSSTPPWSPTAGSSTASIAPTSSSIHRSRRTPSRTAASRPFRNRRRVAPSRCRPASACPPSAVRPRVRPSVRARAIDDARSLRSRPRASRVVARRRLARATRRAKSASRARFFAASAFSRDLHRRPTARFDWLTTSRSRASIRRRARSPRRDRARGRWDEARRVRLSSSRDPSTGRPRADATDATSTTRGVASRVGIARRVGARMRRRGRGRRR